MAESSALISQDDLRPILKFVGRNWYLLLLFPIIGYSIAYIYTYQLPDIYAAKSEILLKQSDTYDYQSNLYQNIGYYSLVQDVINQKRVLKSHNIISETLERLNFTTTYYQKGGVRVNEVPGFRYIDIHVDPQDTLMPYNGVFYTINVLSNDKFSMSYTLGGQDYSDEYYFDVKYEKPFQFTIRKTNAFTPDMLKSAQEFTPEFVRHSQSSLVSKYKSALSLTNEDYTSILSLTVKDNSKVRAKTFLDTLSKVYLDYTLETQVSVNENTRKYIELQLKELETILDSLEREIANFKENKQILDLSKEQDELFKTITELEKEKRQLNFRIRSMEDLSVYTQSAINSNDLPPMLLSNEDQILMDQVTKLFELKLQRTQMLSSSTTLNAEVIKLDTLIGIVRKNIQQYVANTIVSLNNSEKDLDYEIRKTENELKSIPLSQQEIVGIERKFKVNEGLYQYLLEKRASSVIARAAIIPQVSVIESARSIGKVGPNRSRTRIIAIGAGLLLALIIGLIRFIFFDKIEHLREFKELTRLPVVGSIPNYANIKEKPLAIEDDLRSNISESLRALRANLQYILKSDGKPKKILTSSLHPGEGKTFLSTNLSSFIAHTGKKVVILDFDMHKPKVHKVFNLENRVGVSSYLIGKLSLEEIEQDSSMENLTVITAGPIPPNASDLILNEKVGELIAELEQKYDYIFVDTPPLMLISDSLILMKAVDIGLFVFNTEKASKQGIQYLEQLLEQNNITKVSLILNNVKHKKWLYYYGKYSYKYSYKYGSYGYSYAYGKESDKKKNRFWKRNKG